MITIPPEHSEKFTQAPAPLELVKVTKRFGDFVACEGISLSVPPGTVHALLGENGAGCDCEVLFNTAPEWEEIVGYEPPDDTE